MSRDSKTNLTYDPETKTWVPSTSTDSSESVENDSKKEDSGTSPPKNQSTSSNTTTQKEADKEYIEAEFNVLTGELNVIPTTKSIRVKVNDTVKIVGLGKYLSGLYFVSAVRRTLTSDGGYSHSFSLIKNGFGDSVKSPSTSTSTATSSTETETRKEEVTVQSSELKVGDSVKIVGDDAIYSNAHDGVKVPAWVKKKTLTVDAISNDGTRVLLMPIFSWTYIKFVQKV